jgi:hypothetical protein
MSAAASIYLRVSRETLAEGLTALFRQGSMSALKQNDSMRK